MEITLPLAKQQEINIGGALKTLPLKIVFYARIKVSQMIDLFKYISSAKSIELC